MQIMNLMFIIIIIIKAGTKRWKNQKEWLS